MGKFRTFEQYCTWQLFAVHDISPEVALPLVQKLNAKQHAEALSMLLLAFKNTRSMTFGYMQVSTGKYCIVLSQCFSTSSVDRNRNGIFRV